MIFAALVIGVVFSFAFVIGAVLFTIAGVLLGYDYDEDLQD